MYILIPPFPKIKKVMLETTGPFFRKMIIPLNSHKLLNQKNGLYAGFTPS